MLGTFPFEPYFKSYCLFTFRSLKVLKFRLGPCLLPQLPSLLSLTADSATPPPRWVAPGQLQLRLCFALASTRRAPAPRRPLPSRWTSPPFATPPPKLRAAATSPPPWPEQRSTPDPHLSRASAPLEVPQRVPLALSHAPCPDSPNQRRRPPATRRARRRRGTATADPICLR